MHLVNRTHLSICASDRPLPCETADSFRKDTRNIHAYINYIHASACARIYNAYAYMYAYIILSPCNLLDDSAIPIILIIKLILNIAPPLFTTNNVNFKNFVLIRFVGSILSTVRREDVLCVCISRERRRDATLPDTLLVDIKARYRLVYECIHHLSALTLWRRAILLSYEQQYG